MDQSSRHDKPLIQACFSQSKDSKRETVTLSKIALSPIFLFFPQEKLSVKLALLQAARKDEMGTEEKCMYEYNLTLSFEATMGRSVHTLPDKTIKAC